MCYNCKNVTNPTPSMRPSPWGLDSSGDRFIIVGNIFEITTNTSITTQSSKIEVTFDNNKLFPNYWSSNMEQTLGQSMMLCLWNETLHTWTSDSLGYGRQLILNRLTITATYLKQLAGTWAVIMRVLPTPVALSTPTPEEITINSVVLRWTRNNDPDFDIYSVEVSRYYLALGNVATLGRDITTYTVTNLQPGTTYYIKVMCRSSYGENYLYSDSNIVSITTITPFYMQLWFLALVGVGVIGIIAAVVVLLIRRNKKKNCTC